MPIHLTVVTPEGQSYSGTVESVVLPGSEGDFGVLEDHERFLAPLRIGPVEIAGPAGRSWAAVSDGFAEVSGERVVVLVDSCRLAEEVDEVEAQAERDRLRAALAELSGSEEDELGRVRLEAELELVEACLAIAGR